MLWSAAQIANPDVNDVASVAPVENSQPRGRDLTPTIFFVNGEYAVLIANFPAGGPQASHLLAGGVRVCDGAYAHLWPHPLLNALKTWAHHCEHAGLNDEGHQDDVHLVLPGLDVLTSFLASSDDFVLL